MSGRLYCVCSCLALMLVSCSDSGKEPKAGPLPAQEASAAEIIDTVLSSETIATFDRSGYSGFARSKAKDFDWSRFHMVDSWKEEQPPTPFTADKSFMENYGPFLKYSPDSAFAIDLDSYNIEITKNKNGKWIGVEQGPDTEVSLIDFRRKEKSRLVFLGPVGSVEDGGWIDEDNLVLIGLIDNGNQNAKTAVVWKYHLPTRSFYQYQSLDSAAADLEGYYWKERLKGVTIQ